jgi:hypothetical protein
MLDEIKGYVPVRKACQHVSRLATMHVPVIACMHAYMHEELLTVGCLLHGIHSSRASGAVRGRGRSLDFLSTLGRSSRGLGGSTCAACALGNGPAGIARQERATFIV